MLMCCYYKCNGNKKIEYQKRKKEKEEKKEK